MNSKLLKSDLSQERRYHFVKEGDISWKRKSLTNIQSTVISKADTQKEATVAKEEYKMLSVVSASSEDTVPVTALQDVIIEKDVTDGTVITLSSLRYKQAERSEELLISAMAVCTRKCITTAILSTRGIRNEKIT